MAIIRYFLFIVCPLADFDGCSLHQTTPKTSFKLRLNRTEVCRRKPNCVLPIFPLKRRFNEANYSLDGAGGSAVDVPSGGYDDIHAPATPGEAATEDVEFDPLVYDYIIPKAKDVDALRVTAGPDQGGIQISRIPPAKFLWDSLQGLPKKDTDAIEEIFGADLRNWNGPGGQSALPDPQEAVVDDDVLDHPFQEDARVFLVQWMTTLRSLSLSSRQIL